MAYENPSGPLTFAASTGLRQYQFVDLNSSGLLIKPGVTGRMIGVLTSSGSTGSTRDTYQTVQIMGVAKVLSGSSAIAIGGIIQAATDGRASTRAAALYQAGIALAAGVSTSTVSELIPVLLLHMGATAAF